MRTYTYPVRRGQTIPQIASQTGTTVSQILSANPGVRSVTAGSRLNIPLNPSQNATQILGLGYGPYPQPAIQPPSPLPGGAGGGGRGGGVPRGVAANPTPPTLPATPTSGIQPVVPTQENTSSGTQPQAAPTGNMYGALSSYIVDNEGNVVPERATYTDQATGHRYYIQLPNPDGTTSPTPAFYDNALLHYEAIQSGMTDVQYKDYLDAHGYTEFGGRMVYVGQGTNSGWAQGGTGGSWVNGQYFATQDAYNSYEKRKKRGGPEGKTSGQYGSGEGNVVFG